MVILRSIGTVSGFTLISRVLGFIRDILIAAVLGAGVLADVFFVAFKFPNLFRRLFAEGAFSAAFVPLFAGLLEEEKNKGSKASGTAQAFSDQALAVLFWALLAFIVAMELLMPWAMLGFAPGFVGDPDKFDLAVTLTRITFPYLLFISVVSLFAGVLNSLGRFAAAAATPILLNLCLIAAVLWLAGVTQTAAHALAWGVFGAGVVQLVWLYAWCHKAGMRPRLVRPRLSPDIRLLGRRIIPVAIGAGIYQINLLIDTIIASFLPDGSISYLFYADRVNQLPLGVVGVAAGTALLPLLSRQLRSGDEAAALDSQNRTLEFSLLLTLPAAVALMIIAQPVISVLFERGAFGLQEVSATAGALAIYAAGLPAYVLVKALAPGYFARGDTKTPIKVAALAMAVNLALNLALMGPFLHLGIAMATVVSSWLNALILAVILSRRGHLALDARLRQKLLRVALSCAVMGVFLFFANASLAAALGGETLERISAMAALVVGGVVVFGVSARLLGALSFREMMR
jgi:putative peptidoglycan lipid II flippase